MHLPRAPWIVWYAIILHLAWGTMILVQPAVVNITAAYNIGALIPNTLAVAAILYAVALLAMSSVVLTRRSPVERLALLLPQQFILTISAIGAANFAIRGTFADGVERPVVFILADQLPAILVALLHTLAVLDWHGFLGWVFPPRPNGV